MQSAKIDNINAPNGAFFYILSLIYIFSIAKGLTSICCFTKIKSAKGRWVFPAETAIIDSPVPLAQFFTGPEPDPDNAGVGRRSIFIICFIPYAALPRGDAVFCCPYLNNKEEREYEKTVENQNVM